MLERVGCESLAPHVFSTLCRASAKGCSSPDAVTERASSCSMNHGALDLGGERSCSRTSTRCGGRDDSAHRLVTHHVEEIPRRAHTRSLREGRTWTMGPIEGA